MVRRCALGAELAIGWAMLCAAAGSADIDFRRDLQPLLGRRCNACHGADEASREGGFRIDRQESATSAADSGEVPFVPGHPDRSEALRRAALDDDDSERMPPAEAGSRLTVAEIDSLRQWVAEGAIFAHRWAFADPVRTAPPDVRDTDRLAGQRDRSVRAGAAGANRSAPQPAR